MADRSRLWLGGYALASFLAFPHPIAGFARDILGGNEHVVTMLLALFSVGIGIGSLLCERLSGRRVELGLVPFGSIGLTVFAVDLWLSSRGLHASGLAGIDVFFSKGAHWRVAADLLLIGLFGGFFIVPLYALIQERSPATHRSRIIAATRSGETVGRVVLMTALRGFDRRPTGRGVPD